MSFGADDKPAKKAKHARAPDARTVADLVVGEVFTFAEAPMVYVWPEDPKIKFARVLSGHWQRSSYVEAVLAFRDDAGAAFVRVINAEGKRSKNTYWVSAKAIVASPPAPPASDVADLLAGALTGDG